MIQGINLKLNPPEIIWRHSCLKKNPEVVSLINNISNYFKQSGIIYDANLIMSNCTYKTVYTDNGEYRKREDYEFKLRLLDKIMINKETIDFTVYNNDSKDCYNIPVTKDFLYFFEWEDDYYK